MPRRKIPTKAELIQLQKLYKTDEKIAERLGNVTSQLVAYWRRKKNIPKHSFPKFSEAEIRELWERFGDDYRCGLELGISKAAYYNWRRRYGIKHKPAFLKLEQLELNLGGPRKRVGKKYHYGRRTVAQKILADRAGREQVETGEVVEVEADLVMSHANTVMVIEEFLNKGHSHVWNSNRVIIPLDCRTLSFSDNSSGIRKTVRDFVRRQNIRHFYDFGEGACHQLVIEKGHILPGQLAFGADSNSLSYGAIGAFGAAVDISSLASIWASGKFSVEVPKTVKIIINGKMPRGVFTRDVIQFVSRKLLKVGIEGKAIEYHGAAVSQMSISERITLSGLSAGTGAKSAICPFDSITRRYFVGRTRMPFRPALSDKDAAYDETYELNIESLVPQITGPNDSGKVRPVAEVEGLPVNLVIIGSEANGRFDDLRIAADIVKGNYVHADVQLLVFPGSRAVYLEALKKGLIRAFIESGAVVMSPGSGLCGNMINQLPSDGERCLTTTGEILYEQPGSENAEIYQVSPATAASSAINGVITSPTIYLK